VENKLRALNPKNADKFNWKMKHLHLLKAKVLNLNDFYNVKTYLLCILKTRNAMMNEQDIYHRVGCTQLTLRERKTKNHGKQSHVVSILISQGSLGYINVTQNQLLRLIQMLWLK